MMGRTFVHAEKVYLFLHRFCLHRLRSILRTHEARWGNMVLPRSVHLSGYIGAIARCQSQELVSNLCYLGSSNNVCKVQEWLHTPFVTYSQLLE